MIDNAECNGADPTLFETTNLIRAKFALAYCHGCLVTAECEAKVVPPPPAPMSWYDGVAGGKVFSNGVVIAELSGDEDVTVVEYEFELLIALG